jgi:hypothetical protein
MNVNFVDAPGLLLLLPLVWWGVVIYFIVRFLRAFERGVQAHEDLTRQLRLLGERLVDRRDPDAR